MVLRDLQTAKDTVLPIPPLESGWRTVFTRFNTFAPDGKTLASADFGGSMVLWNTTAPGVRRPLSGHTLVVNSVAFCPQT